PLLRSPSWPTVEAAVIALGACRTRLARSILLGELRGLAREGLTLRRHLAVLGRTLAVAPLTGDRELGAEFLEAALIDRLDQSRRASLLLLEQLEGAEAVGVIRRRLRVGQARQRAEALEALSNLGDRPTASQLVALHDDSEPASSTETLDSMLQQALLSPDPWVRLGTRSLSGSVSRGELDRMRRLLSLRRLGLFSGVSLGELDDLCRQATVEFFPEGHALFAAGAPADRFYALLEGSVRLDTGVLIQPAALLGEIGALDREPRPVGARAERAARLLSWPAAALYDWVRRRPELALELFRILVKRCREAEAR
ncbi:MAG: cyclic nucleotide-binding domain-containing protein, partial [Candidatus Eremiobacterota bacterium]